MSDEVMKTASQPLLARAMLAARLELLAAAEMRRFAETACSVDPRSGAEWLSVAGGIAAYLAADSPVNQALGLGMSGPVGEADLERLEGFYLDHGVRPVVSICPLADSTLLAGLSARGWTADGFENVLVRALDAGEKFPPPFSDTVEIREVRTEKDRDLWILAAATGFSWPLPPLDAQLNLGAIVVRRPGTRLFLAFLEGRVAGTAELMVEGPTAWLSADSTLPRFRGRGVQRALQAHRLVLGAESGCDLAVSEAAPGSGSQRNMERAGFRVVYTRVDMVLAAPSPASQ